MRIIAVLASLVLVVTFYGSSLAGVPVSPVGVWTTGLSHTAGAGNDRLLIFTVGWEEMQAGGDRPVASVHYGGRSMTQIVRQVQTAYQGVEIWYLKETEILLATDTNFSVTWQISEPYVVVQYAAATYANVDQTNPIVSFSSVASPNGTPNPLTTNINVVADGYSVAVASHGKGNGGFVWNNGWTGRTEQLDPGTLTGTADHAEAVDGTTTASVTKISTISNRFVLAAVSLSPVTAPPGPNTPPVLATVAAQVVDEGLNLSFDVTATDGDGTIPILSAAGLPSGAGFSDNGDGTGTLSWTPTFSQAGVYLVTFYATDGIETDSTSATITVSDVNRPPVLAGIGSKTGTENILLSFAVSSFDPDGSIPAFLTGPLPAGALFTDNLDGSGTFSWTPGGGQAGVYSVDFVVTDGSLSDSESVSITINATNQPPVLAFIGPRSGDEGTLLTINVSAGDGDGATPVLSAAPLPTGATFNDNFDGSGVFSWTPTFSQAAIYPVTFAAGDGIEADSETVVITIADVNQPPSLSAIGPKTIVAGSNLNFAVAASDPDGTTPVLSTSSLPGGAIFTDNLDGTGTFDWTPALAQVAVYDITFYASDGVLIDSEAVSVTVSDTPSVGPITLLDVNTNNTLATSWTVNNISPGNDRIMVWMVSHENRTVRRLDSVKLGGQHFTRLAQVNTGDNTLNLDMWYLLEVGIQARTDNTISDHRSFPSASEAECKAVLVYENVNQSNPFGGFAIDSVVSSSAKRPMTVSLDVIAGSMVVSFFGEGSPVTPIWNNGFIQTTDIIDSRNSLYGSSADRLFTSAQTAVVSVDASPHRNRHAVIGASLNPTAPPGPNTPPVLATVAAQVVDEGQSLSFDVTATDGDGTVPVLSATGLPAGAGFVNNGNGTGTFSWTPTFTQAGVYAVTFYATDGIDTDSTSTTITVNNVNRPPVLAAIGSKTGIENILLSFNISASDPDGTTPGLSASSLPTGASFTDNLNGSASFAWTPGVGQAGVYSVDFIATDGSLSDSESVSITINATNQPPILAAIGPQSGDEGVLLTITVSAGDGDGTIPVLSAAVLPTGATFNDSLDGSGVFSWTPTFLQAGIYPVTFAASDGFDTDSETVIITIADVNRSPVLDSIGAQLVVESSNLNFVISATDPDGTIPVLTASALPSGAVFGDSLDGTGRFDWTPALAQVGVHEVMFTASDGALVDTELVSITVVATPPPTTAISLVNSWTTGLNHSAGVGSDRLLLFTVGWEEKQARADRPISSVTYGGMPMTQIVRQGQAAYQGVEIWHLKEVDILSAAGTGFNVTWAAGTPSVIVQYAAATYANVNQSTPVMDFSSVATPNGQPNPLTTTVNVVADGYSVAVASHGKGNGGFIWNNGWSSQTEQLDIRTLTGTADHAETVAGTATASVTKTSTTNKRFVLAAVSLAPAVGGGPMVRPQANSSDGEMSQPVDYRLHANYPNPFNPTTQIRFDLPVAGKVRLDVYNILGQNMATLVNGHRGAGSHIVTWNAGGHASGLYLYRLRAGDFDETWKMLLLK